MDNLINHMRNWTRIFTGQSAAKSHVVTVAGAKPSDPSEKIHYQILGTGRKLIFLVPGNNTSGASFSALLDGFRAADFLSHYTVIAPDYRGSGRSTYHQTITSLRDFAHDFDALLGHILQHRAFDQINLVGYSMGFAVALEMMLMNMGRYQNLVGLAPIGTRGYVVNFNPQQAGIDGNQNWQAGDFVPNHDDAAGIKATAFQQRSWQGINRNPATVKFTWDLVVFNDVLKYKLDGLMPTDLGFTLSPHYAEVMQDVLAIRYMPHSLYYCHKFNISPHSGGDHVNANGQRVTRTGDGRLGKNWGGKNVLLVKAVTDYANWRGDLVVTDNYITDSKADLTEAGARVQSVMIAPNQGFDHGFPIAKPRETVALLHQFFANGEVTQTAASQAIGASLA